MSTSSTGTGQVVVQPFSIVTPITLIKTRPPGSTHVKKVAYGPGCVDFSVSESDSSGTASIRATDAAAEAAPQTVAYDGDATLYGIARTADTLVILLIENGNQRFITVPMPQTATLVLSPAA